MPSNHIFFIKLNLLLLASILLSGCNGSSEKEAVPAQGQVTVPVTDPIITPSFNRSGQNNESAAAKAVVQPASLNASGSFSHPANNESFNGNLLLSVDVEDPDGLASVAVSFNQQQELLYLCQSQAGCSGAPFHHTATNINPADYGLFSGPVTLGLWSKDINGNQLQLDSVTVNWQRRQLQAVTAERPTPGTGISANWQASDELFRYNLYLAAESGVNRENFSELSEGQALLAVTGPPQTFSNLSNDTSYYLLVTGVDSSGESAFSSEIRLDPATGQENTPPEPENDSFEADEDNEIRGNLLVNDTDNEQNPLSLSLLPVRPPFYGDLELSANGNFTYLPPENFHGSDSFVYQVQDGQGGFAEAEVSLTLLAVNDPPVALADNYTIAKSQRLFVPAPGLMVNDSDIDSDTVTLVLPVVTTPDFGELILNTDGSFIYTPNDDFAGEDNFRYQIADPQGEVSTALVTILVEGSNTAPLAVNDNYGTAVNITLVVDGSDLPGVLANDSDADGDAIRLQTNLTDNVDNGTLTISTDGFFTYIPNGNFAGTDSFIYAIEDGRGGTAEASVTITVGAANTPPLAVNDNYATDKNTALVADGTEAPGLLANDSDADNNTLALQLPLIEDVSNGQLTVGADGFFTYTPNDDFSGIDTFVYAISDGQGGTAQASVTIAVEVINTDPVANDDSYETEENSPLIVDGNALPGVLENDTDAENDILKVSGIIDDVTNGTLTLAEDGFFTYTPDQDFFGSDSFVYAVEDGRGGTARAGVQLTIIQINSPPVALDDDVSLDEDQEITIDVLANDSDEDGDPLTVTLAGPLSDNGGELTLAGDMIDYKPAENFNGIDSFSYLIDDGHDHIVSAIVTLAINPVNDDPLAVDDEFTLATGTSATLDVLSNDSDIENDDLSISGITAGTGAVSIQADNTLSYTPASDQSQDTFTYEVQDGNGGLASAEVTVNITGVNLAPTAVNDSYSLPQDAILVADNAAVAGLLSNDTDPESDNLTVNTTPLSNTTNGTLVLGSNGSFTYTPNAGFTGSDGFEYQISDGNGNFDSASVVITVFANNQPVANPDDYHLRPNTSLSADGAAWPLLLSNDSDADGDALTYQGLLAGAEKGLLTVSSDSSFTYTPDSNFAGTDSFLYFIKDSAGVQSRALVTLSVEEVGWWGDHALPNLPPLDFNHLSFDGMHYYLLADHNTFTSTDATNWEHAYHEQFTNLTAATAGNTLLSPQVTTRIAVGKAGSIFIQQEGSVSPPGDGVWVEREISVDVAMQDIIFTGSEFVAAGLQKVMFSLDGINWSSSVPNSAVIFHGLSNALGSLVIVGENGTIETSTDGLNWTQRSSTTSDHLYDITSNGTDLLVAVGANGTVLNSSDGISWVPVTSTTSAHLYAVEYGNSLYMAVGDNGTVVTSSDGASWSLLSPPGSDALNDVIWDGGKFIVAGNNSQLLASSDASTFTQVDTGDHSNFNGIAHGNGTVIRGGSDSVFWTSPDAITWSASTTTLPGIINQVEYFNGGFIAVGDNGLVMTSSTGNVWSTLSVPTGENLRDVFWYDGLDTSSNPFSLYVIVGDNGLLMTSSDGIGWAVETLSGGMAPAEHLYGISHDDSNFIAVGQNGIIIHRNNTATPGATTWTDSHSNAGFGQLNDLDYDGSKAIIVGDNGVIVSGSTGSGFGQLSTGFSDNLNTIAYDNGNYISLGDAGATYTSTDGATWLSAFAGSGENLNDVIFNSNEIYAVGNNGSFIRGQDNF
ncbi:tandem-95 repeat protein [Thalassomonas viridans]|uniref:Tandem-95 repeat protein n=1 Tax=Thalassomonas viridans TaxID=137584 RepID=A0AAE9Z4W1_9GAMM|nr:Ig-like domain-containing protein [Thalassomonas viridans]WDE06094.1 tandem-95 repeat protein [Thalassomonas viridans]